MSRYWLTLLVAGCSTVAIGAGSVLAEEEASPAAAAAGETAESAAEKTPAVAAQKRPPLTMELITLTGQISAEERVRKMPDGQELRRNVYFLTTADGKKVLLPVPRRNQPDEKTVDLAPYVGKQVKVSGMGRGSWMRTIQSVELVGEAKVEPKQEAPVEAKPASATSTE